MDKILALDLGRMTGVCVGSCPKDVELKLWDLPISLGPMMDQFEGRLRGMILRHQPLILAIERPFVMFDRPTANSRKLTATVFGQFAVCMKIVHQNNLFPVTYEVRTVRKRMVGRGNADEDMVHRAAIRHGFNPATSHEADAALVWLTTLEDLGDDQLVKEEI